MPISKLTDHTGYWMRMLSNAVSHEFARKVASQGVTVAEWAVMRVLYDSEPVAPSVLAENMGLTRGAISKLEDRLLAKDLITRVENEEDKRAHRLSLTPQGREKIPVLAALADKNDASFFGQLTPEKHETLLQLLRELVDQNGLKTSPLH